MTSLHLSELELYQALPADDLKAYIHIIDPKQETVSLILKTTSMRIVQYSIKMALLLIA
jgi:hypothetical protein